MANTRVYIVPSSDGKQRSAYPAGNWVNVNAPTGLTATVDGRSIVFQLTDTNSGAAAYVIQRSETSNGTYTDFATGSTGATTITTTGNQPGTFYYRAVGVISSVRSTASGVVSATVAAPTVLADGDVVTVNIPGAGSNVAANQFSFLGGSTGAIESGTVGNLFTSIAPSGWSMPGDHGSRITADRALTGTKSLLHSRDGSLYQFGIAYNTGGIRRVGFARASYFLHNPNATTGQLKQIRMVGGTSQSQSITDPSYANCLISTLNGSRYLARNDSPTPGTNITSGTGREWHQEGEWVTVHMRVTDSSAANVADASAQVMTIRESTGEVLGVWTANNILLRTSAAALIRYIVFQYYMGNGYDTACRLYLDRDIAVAYSDTTTPPKFIYLGNAATWAACTKRTYCEWVSWTNNGASSAIEIVVNKGYHATLDNLYVYALSDAGTVINSSGVALA